MPDEHVPTREVAGPAPVDPLIAFFWARLDEVERIARRAGGTWREDGEGTGEILCSDGRVAENLISASIAGLAEHITLHDPQAALDDVATKKAILDDYARYCADLDNPARQVICQVTRDVIKRLAAVHAGHPDYDEAWRP